MAASSRSIGSTCAFRAGESTPSSAPTARENPRCFGSGWASSRPARAAPAHAPTLPRSAFLQLALIVSGVLSPDGRQVAWLNEAGRNREVWLQDTGGGEPRRLMAHTPAHQLAWTRDSRWLLHADPRGEPDLDTLVFDPLSRQPLNCMRNRRSRTSPA
jgi:hypothetical protein